MSHVVIGAFDSYVAAEQAASTLRSAGYADVQVTERSERESTLATVDNGTSVADEGVMQKVKHFFSDLFGDDDGDVGTYAEAVRRGGAVVKVEVQTEEDVEAVRDALDGSGAVNIEERAQEWRASGWSGAARETAVNQQTAIPQQAENVIPVVKETLEIGKRTVSKGGVRVFSRTVNTPVHESVTLRSETAQVERRPVDRPVTASDLQAFGDKTIEVTESDEKAVVQKTARVVEEVVVGKTVQERTEQVNDTVRNTEVQVDKLGADTSYDELDRGFREDYATRYGSVGSYEDYQPAYKYGSGLRSDARYAGRSWDDIEPVARRDWETRYPGSSWERVKAAVRHAWDRVTD